MKAYLQPWQLLLLMLAGWVNRGQQDVINYLVTENRVLRQMDKRNKLPNLCRLPPGGTAAHDSVSFR